MGAVILDASVLIALLDVADSHHVQAVNDVEAADEAGAELVIPASGYSEALVAFAREDRVVDARNAVTGMGIRVAALDAPTAEVAAELRTGHSSLRLPDAMVLATARRLRGELLTYDANLRRAASDAR